MSIEKHFSDDGGRHIDWSRTSADYAEHRPNYPLEFYRRLADRNIGIAGQTILDLGTGVGFLAQQFAEQGASVVGIDVDAGQIDVARQRAQAAGLAIDYRVARAEDTGLVGGSFDAATASQCWLYFDQEQASLEVTRLLRPEGRLVTCHFCWLPREDEVARRSEALVLKYNPQWTGRDFSGEVVRERPKLQPWFDVVDFFVFDAEIPFTRESWRGRFRACRGVGAGLSPDEVASFDREHAELLAATVPPSFTVLHRIDCHLMRPRRSEGQSG
jgi:SAM-dependent methyltransferase